MTAYRAMYRYVVPIDDCWHEIGLTGGPVSVATVDRHAEFWAEHTEGAEAKVRAFRVFGTGHPLPPDARWVASCARDSRGLVFHLYERAPAAEASSPRPRLVAAALGLPPREAAG